ncbi:helix-turn-helix domain-containing protein [Sphingomonas suaedae]|uniref:Helix-turn-helix domain-containing protein n=1 Tax=Sphingomonas suaedae TaxID=2599297 RepID=A0A518RJN7_9SPHN|nr:IclR family transcriptional regulator C-terminal domain-containing protein [Sphingomonas suaedae]QDX27664.1 helix-turn-helix domain-containing protein [Sphingomonas suaedae]
MTKSSQPTVKSAMRTLDIIEYVVGNPGGVAAQDIAAALQIPVSSLSYLLATLCERNYLRREGRRYSAGTGLDRLRLPASAISVEDRIAPHVRALRRAVNETSSFFTAIDWEIEARVTETAEQALRYAVSVGARAPLHCMAAGKAILSTFGDTMFARYFAEAPRPLFTPRTVSDEATLRDQIAAVRDTGFAFTDEEYTLGVCGIARPVWIGGVAVGALAVALPKLRQTPDARAQIMDRLTAACAAIDAGA